MAEKNGNYRVGTGASSLLLILVCLCLAMVSVLGYSAAATEHRLSARAADMNRKVMAADSEAQRMLARVDALLLHARQDTTGSDYFARVAKLVSAVGLNVSVEGDSITFSVPATEQLTLQVALRLTAADEQRRYVITRYVMESAAAESFEEDTITWN